MIFGWIVAAASRRHTQHRADEVSNALLDIVFRLEHRMPLPERNPDSPTIDEFTAPRTARRARGFHPDRRDVV